jgi:type II secretory pathway component GspD/PulD (secretin)
MQSGQTVLLGSLLATTQDESTTGIPLLSAIPLIGDLFKTRKTNDRQTQLLIVVTANIIK